jgi:hypothetical protein
MSRLSKQAEDEFEEIHIRKIWTELRERFGFNLKYWNAEYDKYQQKQPRDMHDVSVFFRFGNDRINPLLNVILGRASGFPTFNNLCTWIITGQQKNRRSQQSKNSEAGHL